MRSRRRDTDTSIVHGTCNAALWFVDGFDEARRRNYHNEKEVGEGIRKSGVPREQIFVRDCVRLLNSHHECVLILVDYEMLALTL